MNTYIGIDPGGIGAFGWCVIGTQARGELEVLASGTCSEVSQVICSISQHTKDEPSSAGIDAPLYWVLGKERVSDRRIRRMVMQNGGRSATVGHVNSLRGACLVQGILSAVALRNRWPDISITETHPKALLAVWPAISEHVKSRQFATEHERDAFLGAYAAWYSTESRNEWVNWLKEEDDEVFLPSGFEVAYWFPR